MQGNHKYIVVKPFGNFTAGDDLPQTSEKQGHALQLAWAMYMPGKQFDTGNARWMLSDAGVIDRVNLPSLPGVLD